MAESQKAIENGTSVQHAEKQKSTNSTYLAATCLQLAKFSLKSHLLHGTINIAEKYIYPVKIQMLQPPSVLAHFLQKSKELVTFKM